MQGSIPQRFSVALDAQASREDRQGFLLDLIEQEVLPRLPEAKHRLFLHIGANRCRLTSRVADNFQSTHAVEPNSYMLPALEGIEGLAVHTEDALAVNFGERFNFVLCDHLLHSIATSRAQGDVEAYLRGLVDDVMEEGGIALIGTLAPRGALHDFLSAVNPAYVGSAAVQRVLAAMPGVAHWVVERSNVASLPSAAQLEQLLELHAALAAPSSTAAAELAGRVCGGSDAPAAAGREVEAQLASTAVAPPGAGAEAGTGVAAAPAPAGPEEAGAGGSSLQPAACSTGLEAAGSDMAKLICRFVDDAADGKGRWNWVEEDDYILLQKLPLPEVEMEEV